MEAGIVDAVEVTLTGTQDCFLRAGEAAAAESARSKAVVREGLAENADAAMETLLVAPAGGVEVARLPELTVLEAVFEEAKTSVLACESVFVVITDMTGVD